MEARPRRAVLPRTDVTVELRAYRFRRSTATASGPTITIPGVRMMSWLRSTASRAFDGQRSLPPVRIH